MTTNYRDYLNIKREAKTVSTVAAFTSYSNENLFSPIEVKVGSKSGKEMVWGVSSNYFQEVERMIPIYGRVMTPEEIEAGLPYCMVGQNVAKNFYEDISQMVGTYIVANGVAFKVLGVVRPYTDSFSIANMGNNSIMIPFDFTVAGNYDKPLIVLAKGKEGYTMDETKQECFEIFAKRQNVDPTDKAAMVTSDMQLFNRVFGMIATGIDILVWIVGMGTLITGVISVSNILLVTVRERQREIGVRRAIGAKPRDIRIQYMAESVLIILIAGTVGILLGLIFSLILGEVATHTVVGNYIARPYPSLGTLILSVLIMLASGVMAGLLPVQKALQIKAIDAIRDE